MTPDWQTEDGSIQLYCGDCLKILPHLSGIDAVVTDPPYSIQNKFGKQSRLDGTRRLSWEWDNTASVDYIILRVGSMLDRCHERGAVACWCGSDQATPLQTTMRQRLFTPKMMAWVKKCPPPAMPGNWWPSGFELGLYGYRRGAWFGDGDVKRSNVWVYDSYRHGQPGKVDHPTQKPTALMEKLVASLAPPSGLCLDGFMGSGTTGVACVRLGRRFIGIELDRNHFETAVGRITDELNRLRLFEPAPKIVQRELL